MLRPSPGQQEAVTKIEAWWNEWASDQVQLVRPSAVAM